MAWHGRGMVWYGMAGVWQGMHNAGARQGRIRAWQGSGRYGRVGAG